MSTGRPTTALPSETIEAWDEVRRYSAEVREASAAERQAARFGEVLPAIGQAVIELTRSAGITGDDAKALLLTGAVEVAADLALGRRRFDP